MLFLDPASCEAANRNIKADVYFTVADQAMGRKWSSYSLYLNPPSLLSQPTLCSSFVSKFVSEYKSGNFKEGLLLIRNGATNASWYGANKLGTLPRIELKTQRFINGLGSNVNDKRKDSVGRLLIYCGTKYTREEFENHFKSFANI